MPAPDRPHFSTAIGKRVEIARHIDKDNKAHGILESYGTSEGEHGAVVLLDDGQIAFFSFRHYAMRLEY